MTVVVEKLYKGAVVTTATQTITEAAELLEFVTKCGASETLQGASKAILYNEVTYRVILQDLSEAH